MPGKRLTPATFFATVLGVGFIPGAPGTYGTFVVAGIYLLLPKSLFFGTGWYWYGLGLLVLSLVAVALSSVAEKKLGHDAPPIVIDEVCGYFLSVLLLPKSLLLALYAFVLFRAFDIAKPWPVKVSQRLPRGWGIVADDLLAGVYTNLIIQIMIRIAPRFFGQ